MPLASGLGSPVPAARPAPPWSRAVSRPFHRTGPALKPWKASGRPERDMPTTSPLSPRDRAGAQLTRSVIAAVPHAFVVRSTRIAVSRRQARLPWRTARTALATSSNLGNPGSSRRSPRTICVAGALIQDGSSSPARGLDSGFTHVSVARPARLAARSPVRAVRLCLVRRPERGSRGGRPCRGVSGARAESDSYVGPVATEGTRVPSPV